MKNKANEEALGNLHAQVANVLTEQLGYKDTVTTVNEEGELEEGEERYSAPPATIAASIKFLKDNNITCDIETNKNMGSLREALGKKQKQSRLGDGKIAALKVVGDE